MDMRLHACPVCGEPARATVPPSCTNKECRRGRTEYEPTFLGTSPGSLQWQVNPVELNEALVRAGFEQAAKVDLRTLGWTEYTTLESPRGRTIRIAMPTSLEILVYPAVKDPGTWISHLCATAVDVTTGKSGDFGSTWRHDQEPTPRAIAEQVTSWLAHEVREQMGMQPHALDAKRDRKRARMARRKRRGWA